jgi:hypothetical protein
VEYSLRRPLHLSLVFRVAVPSIALRSVCGSG